MPLDRQYGLSSNTQDSGTRVIKLTPLACEWERRHKKARSFTLPPATFRKGWDGRRIEANGLRPVIDRTFVLEGLADAFRYEESGKHFGKICLEF